MPSELVIPSPRPLGVRGPDGKWRIQERFDPPVCFVMAGGGAHGAVQWGLLQALSETDIVPDSIIGTSVGALGGAIAAEDFGSAVNRLAYVWAQLDLSRLLGEHWIGKRWMTAALSGSLADSQPERKALTEILSARTFSELTTPFAAVTTDVASGAARIHDSGDLIDALLASSAIPGLLPSVTIDGRPQMDGLASANLPARPAVDRGARTVIVLDTGSRPEPAADEIVESQSRLIGRVFSVMSTQQRRIQLHSAARDATVVVLPTPDDLGGTLDFRETMGAAAQSYALAREFLGDLASTSGKLEVGLHCRRDESVATALGEVKLWPVVAR